MWQLDAARGICQHYQERYEVDVHPDQIVVTSGTSPAMMLAFAALLEADPDPDKVIAGMDDFICRCGTHVRIKKGIKTAAEIMRKEG